PGESLSDYATRLLDQIDTTSTPLILVGLSFGGIIAQEIAKRIAVDKIILISSAKSYRAYNWKLLLVKRLHLHRLASAKFLKWSSRFLGDYFFSTTTKEESRLLHQIINDSDDTFLIWAIDQIMRWEQTSTVANVAHIHGAIDKLFDADKTTDATILEHAGHFLLVSRSQETSKFILSHIT
ncbi:MAG TPA: alpha/beta hydrolase, partial [Cytophagales bacterium]|nr:alpha/beta hydrolase [Cytophagales bacterium]